MADGTFVTVFRENVHGYYLEKFYVVLSSALGGNKCNCSLRMHFIEDHFLQPVIEISIIVSTHTGKLYFTFTFSLRHNRRQKYLLQLNFTLLGTNHKVSLY